MHPSDISRDELAAWAALASLRLSINPLEAVTAVGGVRALFQCTAAELQARLSWTQARIDRVIGARPERMLPWLERLEARGIRLIPITSEAYPPLLRQISCPPAALWVRGRVAALPGPHIAIVGSRQATRYGLRFADSLARALIERGIGVVSGGAAGIDAAAHEGALEGGGVSLAVLGTGIEQDYPAAHRELFERLSLAGACVSEFAPGSPPRAEHFPIRNRLISGLSLGVVVVEAGEKSGALITARFALEQNREVFAVPGQADSAMSVGTNRLIQRGARLVMGVEDVLEEVRAHLPATVGTTAGSGIPAGMSVPRTVAPGRIDSPPPVQPSLEPEASVLYECLDATPLGIDALVERSRLTSARVLELLLSLELAGHVTQLPGHRYVRGMR